jgi:two-component system response regulator FlrC
LIHLDVRVIATSNRDLQAEVRAGRFREDLYYRLNVFPLHVPALRERPGDILPLARFLLARAAHKVDSAVPVLAPAARVALTNYAWPGNIRELDNVMQRALVVHSGSTIEIEDLLFESSLTPRSDPPAQPAPDPLEHERRLILEALDEGRGSRKFAAEKLGISPRTLRYKIARMRELGLAVPGH